MDARFAFCGSIGTPGNSVETKFNMPNSRHTDNANNNNNNNGLSLTSESKDFASTSINNTTSASLTSGTSLSSSSLSAGSRATVSVPPIRLSNLPSVSTPNFLYSGNALPTFDSPFRSSPAAAVTSLHSNNGFSLEHPYQQASLASHSHLSNSSSSVAGYAEALRQLAKQANPSNDNSTAAESLFKNDLKKPNSNVAAVTPNLRTEIPEVENTLSNQLHSYLSQMSSLQEQASWLAASGLSGSQLEQQMSLYNSLYARASLMNSYYPMGYSNLPGYNGDHDMSTMAAMAAWQQRMMLTPDFASANSGNAPTPGWPPGAASAGHGSNWSRDQLMQQYLAMQFNMEASMRGSGGAAGSPAGSQHPIFPSTTASHFSIPNGVNSVNLSSNMKSTSHSAQSASSLNANSNNSSSKFASQTNHLINSLKRSFSEDDRKSPSLSSLPPVKSSLTHKKSKLDTEKSNPPLMAEVKPTINTNSSASSSFIKSRSYSKDSPLNLLNNKNDVSADFKINNDEIALDLSQRSVINQSAFKLTNDSTPPCHSPISSAPIHQNLKPIEMKEAKPKIYTSNPNPIVKVGSAKRKPCKLYRPFEVHDDDEIDEEIQRCRNLDNAQPINQTISQTLKKKLNDNLAPPVIDEAISQTNSMELPVDEITDFSNSDVSHSSDKPPFHTFSPMREDNLSPPILEEQSTKSLKKRSRKKRKVAHLKLVSSIRRLSKRCRPILKKMSKISNSTSDRDVINFVPVKFKHESENQRNLIKIIRTKLHVNGENMLANNLD